MGYAAERLVQIARSVAREAAVILMEGYRKHPVASEKARSDLVTEFDLRSEARVREILARETPDVAFVGEESGGVASGLTWYCDPLDGTMNFVHGHPMFCVSIGVADEAGPLAGAVCAPALGVDWWGGRDIGAFRSGEPCRVSRTEALGTSFLGTGFPLDRSRDPESNLSTFAHVIQRVQGIRRCGSAAIDCCFVADGTYDAYWERRLHAWDLMAGCAIALGAGARLSALGGGRPDLSVGNVILSNGAIHDALVALIDTVPGSR